MPVPPVPIVAGNWKMNTSIQEGVKLAQDMMEGLDSIQDVEKVLCPPFISLEAVSKLVRGTSIRVGAQNMHHEEKGAFTGEVSPSMLTGLCQYVILGHSERRQLFREDDRLINLKVKAAMAAGLSPILCVSETLEQRQSGNATQVVAAQLRGGLESLHNVSTLDVSTLVVAYEPVWAIGTGVPATPGTASEVMEGAILATLSELYGDQVAAGIPLLYGGSVNPDNAEGFLGEPNIHGALVGGASLRADQFVEITRITARAKGR